MGRDIRKILMAACGVFLTAALIVMWAVLVFAPEPVLDRVELRLAFSILFVLAMVYSWIRKTWQPEYRTPRAVKMAAAFMIAVLLLRLVWIPFA